MSVDQLNVLQFAQTALTYALAVFLFPRLLFRERLRGRSLSYQFLFSLVAGNFYMVQITFLLALPGLHNRVTMPVLGLGLALGVYCFTHWGRVKFFFENQWSRFRRLVYGSYGLRLYVRDSLNLRDRGRRLDLWMRRHVWTRLPEWLLLLGALCVAFWYYSYQTFHNYGLGTSDLAVHENWINVLADGKIFANGVYPFGFHCMVYFLYSVFHLDIFVCMRFLGIVQSLCMVLGLYLVMRRLCKNRYTPFVGLLVFLLLPGFDIQVFMRYSWALPQEYGMMLIYPSVLFLWEYLKRKKRQDLWLFGAAFSLTLSGHFYATIAAGLLCLGVGIAYLRPMIKRKMLVPVLLCGVLSVVVSLAPLGIAYLGGTRLEPSFLWAAGVIQESGTSSASPSPSPSPGVTEPGEGVAPDPGSSPETPVKAPTLLERAQATLSTMYNYVSYRLLQDPLLMNSYLVCMGAVFLYCVLQLFRRNKNGLLNKWLSVWLYNVLLLVLLCASILGLPNLMDYYRTSLFAAYAVGVVFAMAADMVLQLFQGWKLGYRGLSALLAAAVLGTAVYLPVTGSQRLIAPAYLLQYNGAFLSMESIKRDFPRQKWTIVSASDELRPIWNKGWHYEIIDFLKNQTKGTLTIPTQYVFFFVEKKAMNYAQNLRFTEGEEPLFTEVSRELAKKALKNQSLASDFYQGQRPAVMSKFYYYLEDLEKRYPNELQVYYEDDSFVCYMLEQSEYSLYNFALGKNLVNGG